MSQLGELDIPHFDRAIYDALGADFLPFPNPDNHRLLRRSMRQVLVEGIDGPGYTDNEEDSGRVPVVFDYPEDIYNRYLLPGIRVKRNESIETDGARTFGFLSGHKYRIPSDKGSEVEVDGAYGNTHYVQRKHAEPVNITYEIEVRARYRRSAHILRKYVRRSIRNKSFLKVDDSNGDSSHFTAILESDSNVSEFIESLNRYHGFILSYQIQGEIDDYEEEEVTALTARPNTTVSST